MRRLCALVLGLSVLAGCGGDGGGEAAQPAGGSSNASGSGGSAGQGGEGGGSGAQAGGEQGGSDAGGSGGGAGASCQDTGQRPSARSEMLGALDTKRHRLVFFGGDDGFPKNCNPAPHMLDELWTYDVGCKSFEQLSVPDGPGARARGAAIYDEGGDRLVLFGGRYRKASSGAYTLYNETWALDLASMKWTQLSTTGAAPSARSNPTAVYAPATREMIVYGGNSSTSGASFAPLGDVWALNLETLAWREIQTSGTKPLSRLFHSAAINPKTSTLFIYGGGGVGAFQGPFYKDLWSLDLQSGTWSSLHKGSGNAPLGRIWSTLQFDPASGRILLFGGHDDGAVGNNNDTWSFDPGAKTWSPIVPPEEVKTAASDFCVFPPDFTVPNLAAPDRRSAQLAGYDPASNAWVIFGGKTDCGIIDDTWNFDLSSNLWSRSTEATLGESCLRRPNPEQCSNLCL